MRQEHPTPYPDVNRLLLELAAGARDVLGEQFTGLYLSGSLAVGDFNPDTSDIDFVVVTVGELPEAVVSALAVLHAGLATGGDPWAAKLEGAYLPRASLRRHDPDDPPRPYVNEGRFQVAGLGDDWVVNRYLLREYGIFVTGPELRLMIDPVGPDDLRRAVSDELREWWAPMLRTPDPRLAGRAYQVYAVLTMCRALHTLHTGTIASKPVAGRWAQGALDERWAGLIADALASPDRAQPLQLSETLDFIRYTVSRGTSDTDGWG